MALALSPVVRALVDPDGALRDIRNLDSVRGCYFLVTFGPFPNDVSSLFISSALYLDF